LNNITTLVDLETLLIFGGFLFGLATAAVVVIVRKETDSVRKGVLYVFLGFLFNFLSCISFEALLFVKPVQNVSVFWTFAPILLTIGLVWGLFGIVQVVQATRSRSMLQKMLKKHRRPLSGDGEKKNG